MTHTPAGANADTAEMIAARQRVLGAGLFRDLDARLAEVLTDRDRIVEVGAGTGHHLAQVLDAHPDSRGLASDVSRAAIRRAAKAHPRMAAVVADTWAGLPIRTGCIDAELCIFAPRNRDEFARIMNPDGILVVVTPLPDHLQQLRARTGMIGIQPHNMTSSWQLWHHGLPLSAMRRCERMFPSTKLRPLTLWRWDLAPITSAKFMSRLCPSRQLWK